MRRRRWVIRRWLALAATLAMLSIAASASAMPGSDGGGGKGRPQSAVEAPDGTASSTWWYIVIAAVVVFGLTLAGAAIIRRADHQRRPIELAH
jgi:ABC-type methionine transport system permease subunit